MSEYKDHKKDDAVSEKMDAKKQDPMQAQKLAKEEKMASAQHTVRGGTPAMSAESQGGTSGQAIGMDGDKSIGAVTVQCASLSILSGPSTSSTSLGSLRADDRVRIYGKVNGFLEVHVGGKVGYISAELTDYGDVTTGEKKYTTERGRGRAKKYTGTKTPCDNPVYAGFVACMDALGIENPAPEMTFDTWLEQLRRRQRLRGGSLRRFGAMANALGVNYRILLEDGDEAWRDKAFWLDIVREALENGEAILVEIDGVAMRVVEVDDKGILVEGGRSDQAHIAFSDLADIGWIAALS